MAEIITFSKCCKRFSRSSWVLLLTYRIKMEKTTDPLGLDPIFIFAPCVPGPRIDFRWVFQKSSVFHYYGDVWQAIYRYLFSQPFRSLFIDGGLETQIMNPLAFFVGKYYEGQGLSNHINLLVVVSDVFYGIRFDNVDDRGFFRFDRSLSFQHQVS